MKWAAKTSTGAEVGVGEPPDTLPLVVDVDVVGAGVDDEGAEEDSVSVGNHNLHLPSRTRRKRRNDKSTVVRRVMMMMLVKEDCVREEGERSRLQAEETRFSSVPPCCCWPPPPRHYGNLPRSSPDGCK